MYITPNAAPHSEMEAMSRKVERHILVAQSKTGHGELLGEAAETEGQAAVLEQLSKLSWGVFGGMRGAETSPVQDSLGFALVLQSKAECRGEVFSDPVSQIRERMKRDAGLPEGFMAGHW
jgi:hypothetical protein